MPPSAGWAVFALRSRTLWTSVSSVGWYVRNARVFLSAVSIALAVLRALSSVRSVSASNFLWMLVSLTPQTSRSRSISCRVSPNWQCSLMRYNCARKSAMDSSCCCDLEWKRKRSNTTDGFGIEWLAISSTSAWYSTSLGLARAARLLISLYVPAPQALSSMALFFSAESTSFASK